MKRFPLRMLARISSAAFSLTLAVSGCGDRSSVDGASPEPIRIVVLGSSTAAGKNLGKAQYGGRPGGIADRYTDLYERLLDEGWPGSEVVNLARSGGSVYEALPSDTSTPTPEGVRGPDPERNVSFALAAQPDAIVVNYPSRRVGDVAQYVANHREIVDHATEAGVPVWVALPSPGRQADQVALQRALRDGLRAEFPERLLDFYAALAGPDDRLRPEWLLTDDLHPNAAGHRRLFEVLVAAGIPAQLRAGSAESPRGLD